MTTKIPAESSKGDGRCKMLEPEENAEIVINTIKHDTLSAEEFVRYWKACSKHRLCNIKTAATTMEIEIDFTVLFPAASSILNSWDQQKLYTVLMSEGHLNNKNIKDMLSDIENLNKTSQEACLLWALHGCLVPWQTIFRKGVDGKKQITRFTIKDSQNAFVMIRPSIEALEEAIRVLTEGKPLFSPSLSLSTRI
ncbi:uncharacterized protein [Eurosta solidaginis]|uniref:uncharacterized protein n=1 Tax=Eurosta solidaginis TaxID=178769 RepID=UPI00353167A0